MVLFSPLIDLTFRLGASRELQRPDPVVRADRAARSVALYYTGVDPPTTGWRSMLPAGHRCHRR